LLSKHVDYFGKQAIGLTQ